MYKRLIRFLSKNTKYRCVFAKIYLYLDKIRNKIAQKIRILCQSVKIGCVSWGKNSILTPGAGSGYLGF